MALPRATEARPFYQSAYQRLADARFLLEGGRTTGAVYLAGYGVECILKSLILSSQPMSKRPATLASFRGGRAHDFEWLKAAYRELGGPSLPRAVSRSFTLITTWSTDLRYRAGTIDSGEADEFLCAAEPIVAWADGRL